MDSLPKQTLMNPNKHLKEQFVSNLDGSSMLEVAALLTIVPVLVLLRYSIGSHLKIDDYGRDISSKKNDDRNVVSRSWSAYGHALSLDFFFIVLPMLLFFTVLSDWIYSGAILLSTMLILSVISKRSYPRLTVGPPFSFRASISSYRVALMLITCLCILAVDFTIFPRRYAKTETYGTSLMDLGVGSFVLANAVVSREARDISSVNWITGLKATTPLFLLGFIRLVTTRGVDYQVHVTEYGVHWNFFFTLAAISVLTSFCHIPAKHSGIIGFAVLIGYQTWLVNGLNTYLLSDERGADIISQNKEGVFSIFGYWGMYLLGVHLGYHLFYTKKTSISRSSTRAIARVFLVSFLLWVLTILLDNYVERISRRLCNMPYVTWVLAQNLQAVGIFMLSAYIPASGLSSLEEAFDRNLLPTFLLANVLTGVVNLWVDTIFISPAPSLVIMIAYAFALSAAMGAVHFSGVRLKFWASSYIIGSESAAIAMNAAMEAHKSLIFVYGTLKTNHPNHFLMEDLITRNDAVFVGHRATRSPHPLVVGLHGIPYMINLPGSGHRVRGELYAVSKRGLARLDELEGIEVGHYERLPIEVAAATVTEEEGSDGIVAAEAYFAHRRFGERLWEKKGRCGMIEYGQNDGVRYVRPRDRPRSGSVLDEIEGFVSSRSD